jgi:hypothetical protein
MLMNVILSRGTLAREGELQTKTIFIRKEQKVRIAMTTTNICRLWRGKQVELVNLCHPSAGW